LYVVAGRPAIEGDRTIGARALAKIVAVCALERSRDDQHRLQHRSKALPTAGEPGASYGRQR
jgi:hypothetical protein